MVGKGIAGDWSVTCMVAALDNLLDGIDIPYKMYACYTEAYLDQWRNGANSRRTRNIIAALLSWSETYSLKNISTVRTKTQEETEKVLEKARIGGRLIIIAVSEGHVVGLKAIDSGWKMVGNAIPTEDVLSSKGVHRYLHICRSRVSFRGKRSCNIITIAPPKKK